MAPSYRARSAKPARFTVVEDVNGNGFSLIEIDEVLLLLCGSFRWNTEGRCREVRSVGFRPSCIFCRRRQNAAKD
jgi:hypothetical protein